MKCKKPAEAGFLFKKMEDGIRDLHQPPGKLA